jgi:hypothetical protein
MRPESPGRALAPDHYQYGFTFKDRRRQPLEALATEARALGFEVVSLSAPLDHWTLQLRRVQSRAAAHRDAQDLITLGLLLEVESFEGMDIARVDAPVVVRG